MTGTPNSPLSVLVVDDSAVVRRYMDEVLSKVGGMSVRTAADPMIAMRKMAEARPDVMILDVEMPRMDGLTFLRKIMAEDPIPVVICSGVTGRGSREAIEALSRGAVEIVTKPKLGLRQFLQESADELIETVRAAARARLHRRPAAMRTAAEPLPPVAPPEARRVRSERARVVGIGCSTGGPEALEDILTRLPEESPPILIVQHMPAAFTGPFAQRLDQICRPQVKEACDQDLVVPGRVLIAPGDDHMLLTTSVRAPYAVQIVGGLPVSRHRPSANVLFRSMARAAGSRALGIILTGMGDDGVEGLAEMRRAGAVTLAQDRASSVIFGMPREALERGAAQETVALTDLPARILRETWGDGE